MLSIARKYYKNKADKIYARLLNYSKEVVTIKNFLKYHEDMLSGLDQAIIRTTGPLDAIFCFYKRDLYRTLNILEKQQLSDSSKKKFEDLALADYMVIAELSTDLQQVKPLLNSLYIDMALLDKLNDKLPVEDKVDLNALYEEGTKKVLK